MKEILIQLFTAFLGALGFAMLFGLRSRHLVFAALGGMIAWGIYLAVDTVTESLFLSSFCAAVFAVAYAEMLAHLRKCPATVFVVPAIIPLVPGSFLYYAMSNAVHGELELARQYGHQTLVCALAIAAGISLAETLRGLRAKK